MCVYTYVYTFMLFFPSFLRFVFYVFSQGATGRPGDRGTKGERVRFSYFVLMDYIQFERVSVIIISVSESIFAYQITPVLTGTCFQFLYSICYWCFKTSCSLNQSPCCVISMHKAILLL